MKKLFFLIVAMYLFAYDARVEPFEVYKIKASVAGKVINSNKNLEAKETKNSLLIKLDDYQNRVDLNNLNKQLKILKEEIKNQQEIVKRKKRVYETYKTLKTKSQTEKDLKFYDYINAKNQLLSFESQLNNTVANIEKLKDIIDKKNIKVSGYVFKIYVNRDDYVAPGMLLADVYDISKEKLYIYVPINEINNLKNKKVYINGKKSNFKINKIWKVPDSQYITSYKVELIGNGLKIGEIIKVEFN